MKKRYLSNKWIVSTTLISSIFLSTLTLSSEKISPFSSSQRDKSIWLDISDQVDSTELISPVPPYPHKLFKLNLFLLSKQLEKVALAKLNKSENKDDSDHILINLPLLNGKTADFILNESNILPPKLAAKYPMIKTFTGYQVDNPANTGRFDLTPHGFHAMFNSAGSRLFIDPASNKGEIYRIYNAKVATAMAEQRLPDEVLVYDRLNESSTANQNLAAVDFGTQLRTYRLAVSAAGEYTQFHGGTVTDGLSEVVTAINRVNQVYMSDLAISLMLVDNNDLLIFTDPATDPFTNNSDDINSNQAVIDNAIGNGNYDIGHVFNTGGGGLAGLRVVCGSRKADGVTGRSSPINDAFYIDYVAHEMGHQFGGNHTFNGGAGSCGSSNRSSSNAFEPGSGSTIMAYAGICGEQNLQNRSSVLFHSNSIDEIRRYITNSGGASCGTVTSLNNNIPTVDAGDHVVIPMQTPFVLTGVASDADAADVANLSYAWEQMDLGAQTSSAAEMIDDGSRPLFQSFLPNSNPSRIFPQLSSLVNGTMSINEVLPTTNRTMNFQLTVRDNRGGVSMDSTTVSVDNTAGPFVVTTPATNANQNGGLPMVTNWNVANTNGGDVNCSSVDISISLNGGISFDDVVLQNTANDGSEAIILPNVDAQMARVKVSCSNGSFFNVSPINFSITQSAGIPVINNQQPLSTDEEQSITITLNDLTVTDEDSIYPDDFSLTVATGDNYIVNGTEIIPDVDFNGDLSVDVTVHDGEWQSAIFPLVISVTPVNDVPSISDAGNTLTTDEDNSLSISLDDLVVVDVDSVDFSLELNNGNNFTVNNNLIIPDTNFNGNLNVPVTVSDGDLDSNTLTLVVTVNSINDVPIAVDDSNTVTEDTSNNRFSVLNNDSDVDIDDRVVISSVSYTGTGSLVIAADQLTLVYTPAGGFTGSDRFSYTISDNDGATATANGNITVNPKPSSGGGSINALWLLILILFGFQKRHIHRY